MSEPAATAATEKHGWLAGRWRGWWLALILLAAAAFRLTGLDWDDYHHYHPDERYIAWVATSIAWPSSWADALHPRRSTFNPFYWPAQDNSEGVVAPQDEARRFAYGHVPLYLGVAATRLVEWVSPALRSWLPAEWLLTRDILNDAGRIEFDHLTIVGRLLTALLDVGTVALLFLLGQRLFSPAVGLLAAAFLAVNVMHIQLAHFWTVDPYVTFFAAAALYSMALALDRPRFLWLAAVFIGLAVGSKFAGIFLLFPLALFCWLDRKHSRSQQARRFLLAVLAAIAAFAITNPFALLDFTCQVISPELRWGVLRLPAINWGNCFVDNLSRQSRMVSGQSDVGFVRQYAGTTPFLYYLEMQFKWGMGPLLAAAALVGFLWLLWRSWGGRRQAQPGWWLALAWIVPFFLSTGGLYVKFMRYMQPVVPFFMLAAAAALLHGSRSWVWRATAVLILIVTGGYALAFVQLYDQPHPWTAASAWIYTHVPPGAAVLVEQWDEPLPTALVLDGAYYTADLYQVDELTWLTGADAFDTEAKLAANLERLAAADYMVIASNRVYGVVPRLPQRYPWASQYYDLLFRGVLGYEVVYVGDRAPHLAGITLRPDTFAWPGLTPPAAVHTYLAQNSGPYGGRADESFTVYDQPLTLILANTRRLSVAAMRESFTSPPPTPATP